MAAPVLAALALLAAPPSPELWLYYSTNLWVDENLTRLEEVWRRAAKSGYRKVLLTDSKFSKLGDMDERYFRNIERVKKLAAELRIEIVPALFSIGYSNDLLWHDPNLAEGLPVRDSLFVVKGGEARLAADPPVAFKEKPSWKDDCVRLDGAEAEISANAGNARLVHQLEVARFRGVPHLGRGQDRGLHRRAADPGPHRRRREAAQLQVPGRQEDPAVEGVPRGLRLPRQRRGERLLRGLGAGEGGPVVAELEDRGGRPPQRPAPRWRALRGEGVHRRHGLPADRGPPHGHQAVEGRVHGVARAAGDPDGTPQWDGAPRVVVLPPGHLRRAGDDLPVRAPGGGDPEGRGAEDAEGVGRQGLHDEPSTRSAA